MNIIIADRKVSVSEELREYARKKCEKLDRYFDRDSAAHVTFQLERGRHITEITVKHAGYYFRAQETSNDMYTSVDGAIDSIERQIQKNKTKLEKKFKAGAFTAPPERMYDFSEDETSVVKVKEFEVKPMSVEDAILQMDLLNHEFFFFKNSDEREKHCVIYKRNNGGYGLIISK